ncbi:MAG TPA: hypothetical protein VM051_08380 [Usitatibacter sp.]|nr:hypothetical protein [Usitatibacter sp.]
MKTLFAVAALAAFLSAGCASQEGATMNALGKTDAPNVHVKDGKRQEFVVGSRIGRETRESPEVVKTISRKGYEEGKMEKPGSPLGGGG